MTFPARPGVLQYLMNEHHARAAGEMRHERLSQHERAEVVRGEHRVPAPGVLRGARLAGARVVDKARERETECGDLCGRAPHAREIRQVAHDRHRVPARALDRPGLGWQPGRSLSEVGAASRRRRVSPAFRRWRPALLFVRLAGWLVRWTGAGVCGRASRAATSSRVRPGA